jgi:hypothetical protein
MSQALIAFENIHWLAHIGEPDENAEIFGELSDICEAIDTDPDAFFEWRDTGSFEGLCLTDHLRAAELDNGESDERIEAIAQQVRAQAWARIPNRRLCELIADDVETIMLLIASGEPLSEFSAARLEWYRKGRVPWGYAGAFPDGRWMVL